MKREVLADKMYACWLGKNIGGTLGAPVEGRMEVMRLTWYPCLSPDGALPNDDLDLQLLNLHALDQYGVRLTANDIAAEWSEHCFFPWDEYGHAGTAMRYGFRPPFSGQFDNHFTDCMGSPIRSEIWAAVCAGRPRLAAYFAFQDAIVDHAGGEGVYGEIFNAALEAAAYASSEVPALIREALTYIPADCAVHGAVSLMLDLYESAVPLPEARDIVLSRFGRPNFTYAPQNLAFELAGLLWGQDFEDAVLKVVNLGYDTDCTVATCGAVFGILHGRAGIPDKWAAPIGDAIRVSPAIRGFRAPADLSELTARCLAHYDRLCLEDEADYPLTASDIRDCRVQRATLPPRARPAESVTVDLRYRGDPIIAPERPAVVEATLTNRTAWPWTVRLTVEGPDGFSADDGGGAEGAGEGVRDGRSEPAAGIVIPAGGSYVYTAFIRLQEGKPLPAARIYPCELVIERRNAGQYWRAYRLPFTLLAPNRWIVDGEERLIPAATVGFTRLRADGLYTAESTLFVPVDRATRLFCEVEYPVRVELDGREILRSEEPFTPFMPAYHRGADAHRVDFDPADGRLGKGRHHVKVTVSMPENVRDRLPRFVFGLNAPAEVEEPGNLFAYLDDTLTEL